MTSSTRIATGEDSEIDLIALSRIAWSHKFTIGLVSLACGIAAVVVAFTLTPLYRAQVIVTQVREEGLGGLGSLAGQLGGLAGLAGINLGGSADASVRDAKAVLKSRRLAEEFIERNVKISELLADTSKPPTMWRAVEQFRKRVLTVLEDRRNETITVVIDADEPVKAARWANAYVALANEFIRTRALDESNKNIAYLSEQITKTGIVEVQRAMYHLVENEIKTHMLANGRSEYAFTVIDPAVVPELRISPKRTLIVLGGLVLGLVVGVATVLVRDGIKRSRHGGAEQRAG